MKPLLLTLLSVLSCGILYAQSNFKHGYVITNSNDTIAGLIDFRTDQINALACTFKRTETSPVETYFPGQIAGYRFTEEGKFYISREIVLNVVTLQWVFLEYLVQGMMNLYFYADKASNLDYYIFEDQDGNLSYVTRRPDEIIKRGGKYFNQKDIQYKYEIVKLLDDLPELKEKASNIEFKQRAMISLVKDYHSLTCTTGEDCVVFEGKPDKNYWKFKFSAYAGMYMFSPSTQLPNMPAVGVQMNVSASRFSKAVSAQFGVSIAYKEEMEWKRPWQSGGMVFSGTYPARYAGFLHIGAKYAHYKGRVRPFVEGGITNMLMFSPIELIYWTFQVGTGLNFQVGSDSFIFLSLACDSPIYAISGLIPSLKLGFTF